MRDGSRSDRAAPGTRTVRGAPWTVRSRSSDQRLKYGVNTAKWSEEAGVTAPGGTAVITASWTCSRLPSASSAARSRSSLCCS